MLAFSICEVVVDVSVEVAGDIGIDGKSDEAWSDVEWLMAKTRDWHEVFLVDCF